MPSEVADDPSETGDGVAETPETEALAPTPVDPTPDAPDVEGPGAWAALVQPSSAWTDLGLTLPIFALYHLLVIFLPVRNAADVVTVQLVQLSEHSKLAYFSLTAGFALAMIGVFSLLGRGQVWSSRRFLLIALEGVVYAVAMRLVAASVVGHLALSGQVDDPFTGLVMSLGAGFYEELAFRVVLFGLGFALLKAIFRPQSRWKRALLGVIWAAAGALVFSGWHHLGPLGEPFELRAFVFRAVCGLAFTLIYATRGFAPAVWTHVLYDVWVLVF